MTNIFRRQLRMLHRSVTLRVFLVTTRLPPVPTKQQRKISPNKRHETANSDDTSTTKQSDIAWWRHKMVTFSALLAICAGNSPVPGEFPTQRPMTRSFDVFFNLRPNNRLSKEWWSWWFETPTCPLWRHRNGLDPDSPQSFTASGIILRMGSAKEGRRYIVTSSLIGWAHTQNDLWSWVGWAMGFASMGQLVFALVPSVFGWS